MSLKRTLKYRRRGKFSVLSECTNRCKNADIPHWSSWSHFEFKLKEVISDERSEKESNVEEEVEKEEIWKEESRFRIRSTH